MADTDIDIYFKTALDIVRKAGNHMKEKTESGFSVEAKSCDIDLVTETDQAVEKMIITSISSAFKDHKFIGEESTAAGSLTTTLTSSPTWIIDPIDGTMNFVHSFPHSCISLALFIDKKPTIGIIYNPYLNQMFHAIKSRGAFLNDKRITVSGQENLSKSLVMMECGTSRDEERVEVMFKNQRSVIPAVHGVRGLGSAALDMAMVAMGAADAYFEFGIHIWDIAAGEVLVREAGGVIMDPAGGELKRESRRVLIAATEKLAKDLVGKLTQFYPKPTD